MPNSNEWSPVRQAVHQDPPVAIPIGQTTNLEDLARQLEDTVRNAKQMPLSSSALIHRKEVLEVIEALKRSIPEEIARARGVIRDREELLERARAEGERLVERARARRDELIERAEIVQAAAREADRLVVAAEAEAARARAEADRYVDAKLATFEIALQRTLAAVERGRARLAGGRETDELAPDPGEDTQERL
ncbi:MAG: hypothetical protein HY775_00180 [Acidobacteria bacterium]|nr:hypothetical protein [Acidobacteriota bacterium]